MICETILSIFPADDEDSRLVIAVEQPEGESSRLVLRQETRGGKVGWFVQSRVVVLPEQVAGLKMALGAAGNTSPSVPMARRDHVATPAILSFAEAAGQAG